MADGSNKSKKSFLCWALAECGGEPEKRFDPYEYLRQGGTDDTVRAEIERLFADDLVSLHDATLEERVGKKLKRPARRRLGPVYFTTEQLERARVNVEHKRVAALAQEREKREEEDYKAGRYSKEWLGLSREGRRFIQWAWDRCGENPKALVDDWYEYGQDRGLTSAEIVAVVLALVQQDHAFKANGVSPDYPHWRERVGVLSFTPRGVRWATQGHWSKRLVLFVVDGMKTPVGQLALASMVAVAILIVTGVRGCWRASGGDPPAATSRP